MRPLSNIIGRLTVLGKIHASDFILRLNPQSHHEVDKLQEDGGYNKGENNGGHNRHELDPQLPRISEEKAVRTVRIDSCTGP